jgi:hypothetical protein
MFVAAVLAPASHIQQSASPPIGELKKFYTGDSFIL